MEDVALAPSRKGRVKKWGKFGVLRSIITKTPTFWGSLRNGHKNPKQNNKVSKPGIAKKSRD